MVAIRFTSAVLGDISVHVDAADIHVKGLHRHRQSVFRLISPALFPRGDGIQGRVHLQSVEPQHDEKSAGRQRQKPAAAFLPPALHGPPLPESDQKQEEKQDPRQTQHVFQWQNPKDQHGAQKKKRGRQLDHPEDLIEAPRLRRLPVPLPAVTPSSSVPLGLPALHRMRFDVF